MGIREFVERHYRHFNARETRDAARGWVELLGGGGKMIVTLAGAMSTAELGISLARLIRAGKVHAICCTGANLEEDVFNLVAHDDYRVLSRYHDLTPDQEAQLYADGLNRVTDTCIPESVMRHLDAHFQAAWTAAAEQNQRRSPWGFMREVVRDDALAPHYQVPADDSWVLAAHEADLPVFVPGWEDSTIGNIFTAEIMSGKPFHHGVVHSGTEQMQALAGWYGAQTAPVGFFQIGGGIAGDFPICVVPMLIQDMKRTDTPFWSYFCQIGDSTTSYGSYSGAVPNEKITWGKISKATPRFMINSDATIVAPLIFEYVLESQ